MRAARATAHYYVWSSMASPTDGSGDGVPEWPQNVRTLPLAALELSGEHEMETVIQIVAGRAHDRPSPLRGTWDPRHP